MPSTSHDVASTCISDEHEQVLDHGCDRVDDLLTVVQHEQHRSRRDPSVDLLLTDAQRRRDGRSHGVTVVHAVKGYEPHRDVRTEGDLRREARLAHAARTDDGDKPISGEGGLDAVELGGAADEARQRTSDGGARRRHRHERRVVSQDRTLERRQRRSRVEPQLVGERAAGVLVCGQSIGLPTAAIQRQHQLLAEALPEGVASDERPEVRHRPLVPTKRELGVDPRLMGAGQ